MTFWLLFSCRPRTLKPKVCGRLLCRLLFATRSQISIYTWRVIFRFVWLWSGRTALTNFIPVFVPIQLRPKFVAVSFRITRPRLCNYPPTEGRRATSEIFARISFIGEPPIATKEEGGELELRKILVIEGGWWFNGVCCDGWLLLLLVQYRLNVVATTNNLLTEIKSLL